MYVHCTELMIIDLTLTNSCSAVHDRPWSVVMYRMLGCRFMSCPRAVKKIPLPWNTSVIYMYI